MTNGESYELTGAEIKIDDGKIEIEKTNYDTIHIEHPITRVEVIDNNGRSYVKHNVERVWLSLQDDYKTLKVMVTYEDEEEICID